MFVEITMNIQGKGRKWREIIGEDQYMRSCDYVCCFRVGRGGFLKTRISCSRMNNKMILLGQETVREFHDCRSAGWSGTP
jgi:hypothetical protein